MLKITEFGKDVVVRVLVASAIIIALSLLSGSVVFIVFVASVFFLMSVFTLFFFRDPERTLPANFNSNYILSPADGKVIIINNFKNSNYDFFKSEENLTIVSIFMSPLNVHVNRIPFTGTIKYVKYIKGKFSMAFREKSSEDNERTEIGIHNDNGKKILFKQIAGFIARRIVCKLFEDDKVFAGSRFGMIKFGSRLDIIFSSNAEIKIKQNQKVKAGESVIAVLN